MSISAGGSDEDEYNRFSFNIAVLPLGSRQASYDFYVEYILGHLAREGWVVAKGEAPNKFFDILCKTLLRCLNNNKVINQ